MNVLHVNKYYHPQTGGVETVVKTLAEGTYRRGHDVRVLSSKPGGRGSGTTHNGVEVYRTSSAGVIQSVPIAPLFPFRFRRHAQWADVIHHHVPNPLGAVSATLTSTDAVSVATYHSDIIRQAWAMSVYGRIQDRFLAGLDHIFVTSPRLLDHSDTLFEHQDRCSVAPLSIDIETYDTNSSEPHLSVNDGAVPIVLFVGRLNYYKGVEYLIRAAQWIDANVVIAGDGERRAELEQLAQDLGVTDTVTFLGYVHDEDLLALYRGADLFVLPSVEPSEAFGIVQIEAMSQQTPVVNTDLPTGVPWVSIDGETGRTVTPADAGALATAISELLADDEKRNRFGQNARRRVEDHFTDEQLLDTVIERYERLLP